MILGLAILIQYQHVTDR